MLDIGISSNNGGLEQNQDFSNSSRRLLSKRNGMHQAGDELKEQEKGETEGLASKKGTWLLKCRSEKTDE